jgi:hypothetical protein
MDETDNKQHMIRCSIKHANPLNVRETGSIINIAKLATNAYAEHVVV